MKAVVALFPALLIAACSTSVPAERAVERRNAAPRAALTGVVLDGISVRTLADERTASRIWRRSADAAAAGFEGDNKGNACFQEPQLEGVVGGLLDTDERRRTEYWQYSVCGEAYEVPVIVTRPENGAVAFTVGSGREAR